MAIRQIHSWITRHEGFQTTCDQTTDAEMLYYSEENEGFSDSDSAADVEELWRQMKGKRSMVRNLKEGMAQKRSELSPLRRKLNDVDNAFMNTVRKIMINTGAVQQFSTDYFNRLITEMQRLRTEYQDLETSYEELEKSLNMEEQHLENIELRFFSILGTGEDVDMFSEADSGLGSLVDVPVELLGISPHKSMEDLHPLFVELTLAIANLQNQREEFKDLLETKKAVDVEVDLKRRVGMNIRGDMVEFMSDYDSREASKREEVFAGVQQVHRLKKLCEENNVMSKHMSVHMVVALDPRADSEDIRLRDEVDILEDCNSLAHAKFPALLSQPDHLFAEPVPFTPNRALSIANNLADDEPGKALKVELARKEYEIQHLMGDTTTKDGKAGFLNRWLLFSLRISPLNALLLYSIFLTTHTLHCNDISSWQNAVLSHWSSDDAAVMAAYYEEVENHSRYYYRAGTPPRSRAASEGEAGENFRYEYRLTWSSDGKTRGKR